MVEIAKELDYSPDAFLFSICAQGMDIDSCVRFLIISLSRFHSFIFSYSCSRCRPNCCGGNGVSPGLLLCSHPLGPSSWH